MDGKKCDIGIDIGTTSVKAVAFDHAGNEISRHSRTIQSVMDDSGLAEQDVQAVFQLVTEAFVRAAADSKDAGFVVDKVGFSAAMHSLLFVKNDGTPLSRAITWVDTRAKADSDALWNSADGKRLYQRTGTPTHPMTPLSKMLWVKRTNPTLLGLAERMVSIKEWVWFQWFGEWCVDEAMAGATGLYNMETRSWDEEALRLAGLTPEKLSRIVATTYVKTGVRDANLRNAGVSTEARFNIGATDGVLANLGVGAINLESLVMTVGTSCAVRMGSAVSATDVDTRNFCYTLAPECYIVGGPSNSGGLVLDWLQRHMFNPKAESLEGIEDLLTSAGEVNTEELYCLPYLTGERAPLWNSDAKASFIGLQFHHERSHLVRAAVEGIIYNAFWIAGRLMEQLGVPKTLIVSGKLFQETWVSQFVADLFGLPVSYTDVDASILGAIRLANIACGDLSWNDVPQGTDHALDNLISPRPERKAAHEAKFHHYRELARKLIPSQE